MPFGLTALAWVGASGSGCSALAAGSTRRRRTNDASRRWAILAGCCSGSRCCSGSTSWSRSALATRRARARACDAAAREAAARRARRRCRAVRRPHRDRGPGQRVRRHGARPVFHLRGGRSLPIPPPWSHLDGFLQRAGALAAARRGRSRRSRASQQLFLWFFLLLGAIGFLVVQRRGSDPRRDPASLTARTLLVVALFSLGHPPAGAATRRLRPLRVGRLRPVRLPARSRCSTSLRRRWPHVEPARLAHRRRARRPRARRVRDPGVHREHATPTTRCRRSARTATRTGSSTTAAPSTTASRTAPQAAKLVIDAKRRDLASPATEAVRRAGEPAQDAVQRRVPLLHAPRARARHVLHRDGSGRWPTPTTPGSTSSSRRPTSRSCRRSGTTGPSRTTPARPGPAKAEAGARRATSATSGPTWGCTSCTGSANEVDGSTDCAIALTAACARSSSRPPTKRRTTSASSCERTRAAVPDADILVVDDNSPDGTADIAEEVGAELGHIDVLRRPKKIGLGDAYRAGFSVGHRARLRHPRADRRRPLARSRPRSRHARRHRRAAPTPSSARATCPAARSRTGPGIARADVEVGQPLRRARARHADPRRDVGLPRVPRRHVEDGRLRHHARQGLRLPDGARVPRLAPGRRDRRGADHVHRPRARQLEDVVEHRAPRS